MPNLPGGSSSRFNGRSAANAKTGGICRTNVMDGMIVKNITSEKVMDARKGVVEFLLINHPFDCPICDQAGECDLQDLSYDHGREGTRYEFKRRTFERHNSVHIFNCT